MAQPNVGLITFGDNRKHEWENVFRGMTEPRHQDAIAYLQTLPINLITDQAVARHKKDIDAQVDALLAGGAEVLVAHIPCWTSPNLVVRGVQRAGLPVVLLGNKHPGTHSTVGLLGAGGTLSQIGYPHLRIRADLDDMLADQLMPYFRAAATKKRMRGKVFGLFGGRSLGIDTGTFDPMQWKKLFGVDTEHIDQLEIVRRAEFVPEDTTRKMVGWLERMAGAVKYNDQRFTPEKLAFQARCYLATKAIIADMGLDFVAIKCMPDMTTHYVPQCISAALLPGPYDADGNKDALMMACEADGDAALTMEILKEISGGKPVLFMDVSYIDDDNETFYFPNCGAFCSWYAARSDDPTENMSRVELRPANRPGGGAITYFTTAPGDLTLARLYRVNGEYQMGIITGATVNISDEEYQAFVAARGTHQLPTAFIKMDVDVEKLLSTFGSNHILGVDGRYTRELVHFCQMLDIQPVFFNREEVRA
ncbi:MAG: L-fucose isomerase [Anaerolineaceae bacterium]|nr:L-fucose isomerase [Anaerolineaceae bacterium]